jgi:hypothetical protein
MESTALGLRKGPHEGGVLSSSKFEAIDFLIELRKFAPGWQIAQVAGGRQRKLVILINASWLQYYLIR